MRTASTMGTPVRSASILAACTRGLECSRARVQATIANGTIPPLPARVSLLTIAEKCVVAIEVDEATTPVGTKTGRYTRRALRNDGMPECTPYPLHEMLSTTTSAGESDYATLRVPGAT